MDKESHLTDEEIQNFRNYQSGSKELDRINSHLLFCDSCCRLLSPPTVEEMWRAILAEPFEEEKDSLSAVLKRELEWIKNLFVKPF